MDSEAANDTEGCFGNDELGRQRDRQVARGDIDKFRLAVNESWRLRPRPSALYELVIAYAYSHRHAWGTVVNGP